MKIIEGYVAIDKNGIIRTDTFRKSRFARIYGKLWKNKIEAILIVDAKQKENKINKEHKPCPCCGGSIIISDNEFGKKPTSYQKEVYKTEDVDHKEIKEKEIRDAMRKAKEICKKYRNTKYEDC